MKKMLFALTVVLFFTGFVSSAAHAQNSWTMTVKNHTRYALNVWFGYSSPYYGYQYTIPAGGTCTYPGPPSIYPGYQTSINAIETYLYVSPISTNSNNVCPANPYLRYALDWNIVYGTSYRFQCYKNSQLLEVWQ